VLVLISKFWPFGVIVKGRLLGSKAFPSASIILILFIVIREAFISVPAPSLNLKGVPTIVGFVTFSKKSAATKLELVNPPYWESTKAFNSAKFPDNDVSQNISNKDSTGSVSATDKKGTIENTAVGGEGGAFTEKVVT